MSWKPCWKWVKLRFVFVDVCKVDFGERISKGCGHCHLPFGSHFDTSAIEYWWQRKWNWESTATTSFEYRLWDEIKSSDSGVLCGNFMQWVKWALVPLFRCLLTIFIADPTKWKNQATTSPSYTHKSWSFTVLKRLMASSSTVKFQSSIKS